MKTDQDTCAQRTDCADGSDVYKTSVLRGFATAEAPDEASASRMLLKATGYGLLAVGGALWLRRIFAPPAPPLPPGVRTAAVDDAIGEFDALRWF
jgi:hypothetical protein